MSERYPTMAAMQRALGEAAFALDVRDKRIAALESELREAKAEVERLRRPEVVLEAAERLLVEMGVGVLQPGHDGELSALWTDILESPAHVGPLAEAYSKLKEARDGE